VFQVERHSMSVKVKFTTRLVHASGLVEGCATTTNIRVGRDQGRCRGIKLENVEVLNLVVGEKQGPFRLRSG